MNFFPAKLCEAARGGCHLELDYAPPEQKCEKGIKFI